MAFVVMRQERGLSEDVKGPQGRRAGLVSYSRAGSMYHVWSGVENNP